MKLTKEQFKELLKEEIQLLKSDDKYKHLFEAPEDDPTDVSAIEAGEEEPEAPKEMPTDNSTSSDEPTDDSKDIKDKLQSKDKQKEEIVDNSLEVFVEYKEQADAIMTEIKNLHVDIKETINKQIPKDKQNAFYQQVIAFVNKTFSSI